MLEIKIKYELVKVLSVHQIVVKHFLDHEHHLVSFVATKQHSVSETNIHGTLSPNFFTTNRKNEVIVETYEYSERQLAKQQH